MKPILLIALCITLAGCDQDCPAPAPYQPKKNPDAEVHKVSDESGGYAGALLLAVAAFSRLLRRKDPS